MRRAALCFADDSNTGIGFRVADNGSDAGRARNRRVELKVAGCGT